MRNGDGVLAVKVLKFKVKSKEDRKLLDRILRDDDLCDIVTAAIEDEYPEMFGDEVPKPGNFQSFLQWILDHQEEIIAFIKVIMVLFEEGAVATV